MRKAIVPTLVLGALLLAVPLQAVTVTWTTNDAPLRTPIDVDFEGDLIGVSAVSIGMSGYAGGQHGYCQDMGGEDTYFWLPFAVGLDLEGMASGGFMTTALENYDATAPLALVDGQPDWSFLDDGRTSLNVTTDHGYDFDLIRCYPTGYQLLTLEDLTVTVTCTATVPLHRSTWGAVKSLYR